MIKARLSIFVSMLSACALLGTGCSLMPKEDNSTHTISIETQAVQDYELCSVTRGDVVLSRVLYSTYTQMKDAELSFQTGSLVVRFLYVSVGDSVHEGDLLAQLDTSELEAQYSNLSYSIESTTLAQTQAQESWDYELSELKKSYKNKELDKESFEAQKTSLENRYTSQLQGYEDTLYISRLRLEDIQKKLDGSSIYATMDGTISEIQDNLKDSWSVAEQSVIKIIDTTNCAFVLEDTDYAKHFENDSLVTLTDAKGNTYEAKVRVEENSPEEDSLDGTSPEDSSEEATTTVYFDLTDSTVELPVGTRVTYSLILDSAENVLKLPNGALHKAGDHIYVYTEDESGLKSMKYVTIGLAGTNDTEITEGLSEGDVVIIK